MAFFLRKSSAQARIEGWDPRNRSDNDYDGRFLQSIPEAGPGRPIPPPNQGMADTLDEAQAAFKKRYEEVRRGK